MSTIKHRKKVHLRSIPAKGTKPSNKYKPNPDRTGQPNFNGTDNYAAAKLAVIAGAVNVFGDVLATIAAALALEESVASDYQDQQNQKAQEANMVNMQKQIDELTLQIKNLTKK
ncbi:hypothetical protein [Paenibacillus harenae]|uniref:Translation initiation factor 2 n=1 Tax=Paenibacillus harenae TaxID=306543 RepID=A0ABT9U2S9_PAEHA|nr:hypothetical protein [Paenibacillus harenae]MDQ0062886.1 hypothetical protein [Paenibacillus harenae]MDQ0113853.1 hypothetical protein [Paenibacillus harenae]